MEAWILQQSQVQFCLPNQALVANLGIIQSPCQGTIPFLFYNSILRLDSYRQEATIWGPVFKFGLAATDWHQNHRMVPPQ